MARGEDHERCRDEVRTVALSKRTARRAASALSDILAALAREADLEWRMVD
jgi:hypothetical protein